LPLTCSSSSERDRALPAAAEGLTDCRRTHVQAFGTEAPRHRAVTDP
jgi:hypothetical protein